MGPFLATIRGILGIKTITSFKVMLWVPFWAPSGPLFGALLGPSGPLLATIRDLLGIKTITLFKVMLWVPFFGPTSVSIEVFS